MLYRSKAEVKSPNAAKYLTVMCRHFARKVPAKWDDNEGRVDFSVGTSRFILSSEKQVLTITCEAEGNKNLEVQKSIIESHVALFSRKEAIQLKWR